MDQSLFSFLGRLGQRQPGPESRSHLRKFSSAPEARPAAVEGLSEKTSTRRLLVLVRTPDGVTGVARRHNKSADGDGVDCKRKKTVRDRENSFL